MFSEAKLRYVDLKELHDLHDSSPFGYFVCKIIVVMERERSKSLKVHQTLISNRIHGALMLAQFTKICKQTQLYRGASVTGHDQ